MNLAPFFDDLPAAEKEAMIDDFRFGLPERGRPAPTWWDAVMFFRKLNPSQLQAWRR